MSRIPDLTTISFIYMRNARGNIIYHHSSTDFSIPLFAVFDFIYLFTSYFFIISFPNKVFYSTNHSFF